MKATSAAASAASSCRQRKNKLMENLDGVPYQQQQKFRTSSYRMVYLTTNSFNTMVIFLCQGNILFAIGWKDAYIIIMVTWNKLFHDQHISSKLHQIRYLSLSPAMQNTEYPCHDVARQQKPSSSQQKKLQRIESAQSTIWIANIQVKMKPTTHWEHGRSIIIISFVVWDRQCMP